MFRKKTTYLLLLLCLLPTACIRNARVEQTLQQVGRCLPAAPDSALCLLQRIDPDDISRRRTRAEYALLYSITLDKNRIFSDNDSLTRIARNYYRRRNEPRKRFLAEYYHALVRHNRKEDSRALVDLLRIEDQGRRLGDPCLLGQLYSQISEIYRSQYNYSTMMQYARQAYDNYLQASKPYHCAYALFDIGEAHFNLECYDSAGIYYARSLQLTEAEHDTTMMQCTLGSLALTHIVQNEPDKACSTLWQIRHRLHREWNGYQLANMAFAHQVAERLDSAQYYLRLAEKQTAPGAPEQEWLTEIAAKIHFRTKEFEKAAKEYRKSAVEQDSIVRIALQQSYADVHRDFLDKQQRIAKRRLHVVRRSLWLMIALVAVLVLFAGFASYVFYRKRQFVMQKYISAIDEIKSTNKLMMLKLEMQHRNETEGLHQLAKSRFDVIDQLASTYYERQGANEQRAIYNKVKQLLDAYATDARSKQEIETVVNMCYDNIMQKVRAELPQLKETELDLLRYIYAGFSLRVISVFTGDSINYTAVKKSRLKAKIAESAAPSKELFIKSMP